MSTKPIHVQLDYYMSPQFAGIAVALEKGFYDNVEVKPTFMATCPPGCEANRVSNAFKLNTELSGEGCDSTSTATIGVTEQNILFDVMMNDPGLSVKAVSAMFRASPLRIASLSSSPPTRVGAHYDTVALLSRLLPAAEVVSVPRSTKLDLLEAGEIDAVQIYETTETVTLGLKHPNLVTTPLSALGASLGYGQVIFAPNACINDPEHASTIRRFLDATFEGWRASMRDPAAAVRYLKLATERLKLDDEAHTHYPAHDDAVLEEIIRRCNDLVAETKEGNLLGTIDRDRYNFANDYLGSHRPSPAPRDFALSPDFYQPPKSLMVGCELARDVLDSVSEKAAGVVPSPSLTVVTVGTVPEGDTHDEAGARRMMYSPSDCSWYDKVAAGKRCDIDVKLVNLPEEATTEDVLKALEAERGRDGIQLTWPLPPHIDAEACYSAIPVSQDVDGLVPNSETRPVTVDACLALLGKYDVDLDGKSVVVLGRSKILGAPFASAAADLGATVTLVHSNTTPEAVIAAVSGADVVASCVGKPGVVDPSWIKPGAVVLSVGKIFTEEEGFLTDVPDPGAAGLYSSAPGGVGPLAIATLLRNVADKAALRASQVEDDRSKGILADDELEAPANWKSRPLTREFHFNDYPSAMAFVNKVVDKAEEIDHHPNFAIEHFCTEGVGVTLKYQSYDVGGVTSRDVEAAQAINDLWEGMR